MIKILISFIVTSTMLVACKSNSNLIGYYTTEYEVSLELKKDKQFTLNIPRSPLDIEQEAIEVIGNYQITNKILFLDSQKTNGKSYTIDVPPQTRGDNYEFMIKGKDWGRLEGVRCEIREGGKVVQESITNQMGVATFTYTNSGALFIDLKEWETLDLNLEELEYKSLMITLEKKGYKNNLDNYEFQIADTTLKGRGSNKHWEFKKKTR